MSQFEDLDVDPELASSGYATDQSGQPALGILSRSSPKHVPSRRVSLLRLRQPV